MKYGHGVVSINDKISVIGGGPETGGYTYEQRTRELRMSPNQIRKIIKSNEAKKDAIANKKKMLSLSSQAYKLYYKGMSAVLNRIRRSDCLFARYKILLHYISDLI